ncbi:N,O-diacetylmuramidase [Byssothecium circinans]|uniref:N,O-diacetylmuramidase n=1 Tax=Byssothecium circinans TaxID=147558 RepID=A0A6A5U321_9PLEO|nr:N,O-diacetylmuramidase [Byssothecium circinans]
MHLSTFLPTLFLMITTTVHATIQGLTISHYQSTVNFTEAHFMGLKYIYIKATEGITYIDPKFSSHWADSTNASLYRGAYHLARPSASSGAAQASWFIAHGGGWKNDNMTLPGLLELPTDCVGSKPAELVSWITEFSNEYKKATGRFPVLYTWNTWWVECAGNTKKFRDNSPLMLANWREAPGMLPGGWDYWTFWQYLDESAWGGESNLFHGDAEQLAKLVVGA